MLKTLQVARDAVFLNGHVAKLPAKYRRLYPQPGAARSLSQRRFLLQWGVLPAEMYCWGLRVLGHIWEVFINIAKEGAPEDGGERCGMLPSGHDAAVAFMISQHLWYPPQVKAHRKFQHGEGRGSQDPRPS